jgi:hypothetical protein
MTDKEIYLDLVEKYNLPRITTYPICKKIVDYKEYYDIIYFIFDDNTCMGVGYSVSYSGEVEMKIANEDKIDYSIYFMLFNEEARIEFCNAKNIEWEVRQKEKDRMKYEELKKKFKG